MRFTLDTASNFSETNHSVGKKPPMSPTYALSEEKLASSIKAANLRCKHKSAATCPPKVNAIGYKFYGDVQEGGFRCYIDQDACISCSACFSSDECPSGALIEVLPDGEVLDFTYTPPDRLDFDLRFLHRFHREAQ